MSTKSLAAAAPSPGIPSYDIDPYDPAILEDPEPFFSELRQRGHLVWLPHYGIFGAGRYDVVREIFSDWRRFVSGRGVGLMDLKKEKHWRTPGLTAESDPPIHDKMRKVVARALSARAIANLRQQMTLHADSLIDRLLNVESFDAIHDLAEAFPLDIFPTAVGIGQEHRERLITYASITFNFVGPDNDLRRTAAQKGESIIPWVNSRCERAAIAPSGLAATIYVAADNGEITESEAALLVRSLLSAGIDTTMSGIGNALYCLAHWPEQFEKLRSHANPEAAAKAAFDEGLRRLGPVTHFYRTADEDTQLGGIPVPEGSKIYCALGAANLDPSRWTDPTRYDIERNTNGHLAFGIGIHNCLGQVIARAEAETLLAAMARRVKRLELTGPARWRPNNSIRGLDTLPMRFQPR
jgi:cytochrome P450